MRGDVKAVKSFVYLLIQLAGLNACLYLCVKTCVASLPGLSSVTVMSNVESNPPTPPSTEELQRNLREQSSQAFNDTFKRILDESSVRVEPITTLRNYPAEPIEKPEEQ